MDCPKCSGTMNETTLEVLHGRISIDRCDNCHGLWFDNDEAHQLKDDWMSDFVDRGDPEEGRRYNRIRDIDCPRCGKRMEKLNDNKQKHIEYEACPEHGLFFDAGEFTDFKHETLMDLFRDVVASLRRNK